MRKSTTKFDDQNNKFSCCRAVIEKLKLKDILRQTNWERLKWKYEKDSNDSCLCKVDLFSGKYNTSITGPTTDASAHTFTYKEHDGSNNDFTDNITDHVTSDLTDADEYIQLTDIVTDTIADAPIDDMTDVQVVKDGPPEVITDKDNGAIDKVININEKNDEVTEIVDVFTDEVDKVFKKAEDLNILSDITTTEENASYKKKTVKHGYLGYVQKRNTLENSETKGDNNINSEYVPEDSALKQLVSFLYPQQYKDDTNVESPKIPTSIAPKQKATEHLIARTSIAVTTNVPNIMSTKQVSAKITIAVRDGKVNNAVTHRPVVMYRLRPQKAIARKSS